MSFLSVGEKSYDARNVNIDVAKGLVKRPTTVCKHSHVCTNNIYGDGMLEPLALQLTAAAYAISVKSEWV